MNNIVIGTKVLDTATVVSLGGDIDIYSAGVLRNTLLDLAAEDTDIVADLSKVEFLDSTGLGVLIGAWKKVLESGNELVLAEPNTRVKKVFDITNLSSTFSMHDSVASAVEYLASKKGA